ncbi:MurR/RpiR family transcriptional regulator [Enterovibrio nigricans]|uniref:Transcriptional regulator, RpiR family n=1 Tax=Enterovibrio nigricans DSM 22720 TaxID=1121868 RepID=A0A1T4VVF7_9GAMM|nr:MurR/RpiR family transcriptional regulator [Enterovibrio nigricans]SKA68808.1 transcriptional regulator, RpiR family [Enterovibrio nigricans DSM 22720]
MNAFVNKVKALLHSKRANERKISQFIVDLGFDLAEQSATKVGAQLGMSDSSIIRYAKSLGCSGFPDLKLKLAASAQQMASQAGTNSLYQEISSDDTTETILSKSKQLFTDKIEQSLSLVEPDIIDQCAEVMLSSGKIVLTGIGASAIVASDINHKLIRTGLNVHFNSDYHSQIVQASLLTGKDLLIVISARGETPEVITAIEKAKEAGAKVIALTRFGKGKVALMSDYVIPYSYSETHEQLGMVTSQLLQMVAFDVLYFKLNTLIDQGKMSKALRSIRTIQK